MNILMPLPVKDFDPTEAGVSYAVLADAGHTFTVATPDGTRSEGDGRMLTGEGLALWKGMLRADANGRDAHARLAASEAFHRPIRHDAVKVEAFQALVLPGGHAPAMRTYLESVPLQQTVAAFFAQGKPVAAICHGVVVAARSRDVATGKSVLHGRRTTALVAWMELSAWALTGLWLGRYYRTYPQTVEAEVRSVLSSSADFLRGPFSSARDSTTQLQRGFTVRDGNYLSARWPGDAHRFATEFAAMLQA
jgi:protease I